MDALTPHPGPYTVEQWTDAWHDPTRRRDLPVRVYQPAHLSAPAPLVLFSHGTGSSRDGYSYLGHHWASHGYIVVHPTHVGTDRAALYDADGHPLRGMPDIIADARYWTDRPADIAFAISHIASGATLAERVDLNRIAVAGHSYGAHTALAAVGLRLQLPDGTHVACADPRVRAAIAMSPASEGKLGLFAGSWSQIDRPVLALTGTRDIEYKVGTAQRRRTSFDRTPGPDQYLVTIRDATHAAFDDEHLLRIPAKPQNPEHHDWIRALTTAFLDAYLRNDRAARQWLSSGALRDQFAGTGAIEHKHLTPVSQQTESQQP